MLNLIRGLYKAIDEDWRKCASKSGLTVSQQHMLYILFFENGSTLSEISKYGLWHLSTVVDLVERMERSGLVRKEIDSNDARTKRVYITEKGIEKVKATFDNAGSFKFLNALELDNIEKLEEHVEILYRLNQAFNGNEFVQFVRNSKHKLRDYLDIEQ
ncbi:MAG: winged helix DNA-binding protein [Desulfotomaculum sp.]|nr:winged helix DNA-binding protein [Desulfotomaculum sp.]